MSENLFSFSKILSIIYQRQGRNVGKGGEKNALLGVKEGKGVWEKKER